jgi:hypothetical protein
LGHDFNLVHNSKQRQRIKKTKETKYDDNKKQKVKG